MAQDSGCLAWEELPTVWVSLGGQWVHSWALLQVSQGPLVSWLPQVSVVLLVPQVSPAALVSLVLVKVTDVARATGVAGTLGAGVSGVHWVRCVSGLWWVPRLG